MKFLKVIGNALRIGAQIFGLAPAFTALTPTTKDDLVVARASSVFDEAIQAVVLVETSVGAIQGATGPMKFEAAVPLVQLAIRKSEALHGREIVEDALFIQGCRNITQGVVDILNSLKGDVKTKDSLPS